MTQTTQQVTVDPNLLAALQAQVEELRGRLAAIDAASAIAPPPPRFETIFDLFRELASRTLASDVLHEFLATVDSLEDDANPGAADAPPVAEPGAPPIAGGTAVPADAQLPPAAPNVSAPPPGAPSPVSPAVDPVDDDGFTAAQRAAIDAEVDAEMSRRWAAEQGAAINQTAAERPLERPADPAPPAPADDVADVTTPAPAEPTPGDE